MINESILSIKSRHTESLKRELYLNYDGRRESNGDSVEDDCYKGEKIVVILHTDQKTSLEIGEMRLNGEDRCSQLGTIWSPNENTTQKGEFDHKHMSSLFCSEDVVYIGFTNGSVRQYTRLGTNENVLNESKESDGVLIVEDNYYKEMFGESQEEKESAEDNREEHWLNNKNDKKISSRLLMKHMGYPVCIRENNNSVYVLYDDGVLMSSDKEYSRGYNVKRYYETFEGSIYFALNSKGDRVALSTNDRRLVISSIDNSELESSNNSKKIMDIVAFKKTSFESSERKGNPHNILNVCWSLCDRYLFIPGETEVRVIEVDKHVNQGVINMFERDSKKGTRSEICSIKTLRVRDNVENKDLNLLISLDILGGISMYTYEDELLNIRELEDDLLGTMAINRNRNRSYSYPISFDVVGCKNTDKVLVGVVLNTGEVYINEFSILNMRSRDTGSVKLIRCSNLTLDVNGGVVTKNLNNSSDCTIVGSEEVATRARKEVNKESSDDRGIFGNSEEELTDEEYSGDEKSGGYHDEIEIGDKDRSDSESNDFDQEYDDEYDNWNRKELGKHIDYLRRRVERLKEAIDGENESQFPVIPGYNSEEFICKDNGDLLIEENREYLLCWNHSGYMVYTVDGMNERPMIDLECYNSPDGPKKMRVYDTKGFNMGNVGTDGYLLGRKAKSLENGKYISSIIEYRLWRTWGRNDKTGWTKELLVGEDLICMTCSKNFVAVMTSLRYLRIWRNSGISKLVIKLLGFPVCCVSNDDFLLVVAQKEPFYFKKAKEYDNIKKKCMSEIISGKCNTYETYVINVNYETILYNESISIMPGTVITWCGITNKGVPVIKDSSGQTYILSRQWKNQKESWIPCTNFGLLEKNIDNKYFILSLEEDYFNVVKLPHGYENPIPLMVKNSLNYTSFKVPYNVPILGLPSSIRQWMNIVDNDKTLNEYVTNDSIPWEVVDELVLKLDIKYNTILSSLFMLNDIEYETKQKQYKLQKEKLLMRLYMKLLVKQLVEPAFDVVRTFSFPKSFQIALEQAEKSGERILSSKISQEIQIRSKIEQGDVSLIENTNLISHEDKVDKQVADSNENIRSNIGLVSAATGSVSIGVGLPFKIKSRSEDESSTVNKEENNLESASKTIKFYNDVIKKRKV